MTQLYDVTSEINRRSLQVYDDLLQACAACAKGASRYDNLGVFAFHTLQCFLTAYLYRKTELELAIRTPDLIGRRNYNFPYWDYDSVRNGLDLASCKLPGLEPNRWGNRLSGILTASASSILARKRKTIAISPTHLDAKRLGTTLLRRGYRLCFPATPALARSLVAQQWPILADALRPILDTFKMPATVQTSALNLIQNYLMGLTREHPAPTDYDIVLSGSMLTLSQRLLGAHARNNGKPLFVPIHGDADGFLDEPWSGYGEATYPTHFISYGIHGDELRYNSRYARSILGEVPRSIPSSSPFILKNLPNRGGMIRGGNDLNSARILYIPTSYQLFVGYGPFHSAPDLLYSQWQQALFEAFPNLTVKEHPINVARGKTVSGTAKDFRSLETAIFDYDIFILDYISTGLNLAVATDKPVIYFDLGIRNPTAATTAALKERCIYLRPESFEPAGLRKSVLEQLDLEKRDAFTPEFSVCDDHRRREDVFASAIDML